MDRKYYGELYEEVRKLAGDIDLSVALKCLARLVAVVLNDAEVKCVY